MRLVERGLVGAVSLLVLWIAVQAYKTHSGRRSVSAALAGTPALGWPGGAESAPADGAVSGGAERLLSATGSAGDATDATKEITYVGAATAAPVRDLAEIRRRLNDHGAGTYIGDILAERDSMIARWPDRTGHPLKVWVQSADRVPGWNPVDANEVRDAFATWSMVGVPVPFTFVLDSTDADVHVVWIDHFNEAVSGKTAWAQDRNFWIVGANIVIALHSHRRETLDAGAIRAIALHEVGHLLGLDHSSDTLNIMAAHVHVRDLSAADRATLRLVYELPPGPVR